MISDNDASEANDNNAVETSNIFDSYINVEVGLPRGNDDEIYHEIVKRCAIDDGGKPLGVGTYNPINDKRLYEVEYLDRMVEILAANVIAENLLPQVDQEGHRQLLIDNIIDHSKIP